MNSSRERVQQAAAGLDTAAREFSAHRKVVDARLREPRLATVIGSGFTAGFLAALFPLRAWPKFAANIVRVGATLVRLPMAPVLIALASKKYRRRIQSESHARSE